MRFAIRNYLASLKEDGELDRICVEMLEDIGLTVLVSPQKGTRQYGVDVTAKGRIPGDAEDSVYLLVIKRGIIDRKEYEREKQGVRSSIREIPEVYLQNHLPAECEGLPVKICVVCGGEILPEVRENLKCLEVQIKNQCSQFGVDVSFQEWNGAKIAELLMLSLDNPNHLLRGGRRLLLRSLALAGDADQSYASFRALIDGILISHDKVSNGESRKRLHSVVMALAMLANECENPEVNNRDAAWRAAEYAYLRMFEYDSNDKVALDDVARLYRRIANSYLDRISLFTAERYAFTLSVRGNNEVDVVLRFYDVLGRLASFGLYLQDRNEGFETRKKILSVIEQMLIGNTATVTPLLDAHVGPIGMALLFMSKEGRQDLSEVWLELLMNNLPLAFAQLFGYPVTGLDYTELLDHMHANERSKDVSSLYRSSELLPMLMMMAKRVGREDICKDVSSLANKLPPNTDYQMWFLSRDSEKSFYLGDSLYGTQLCSLPLNDYEKTISIIQRESQASPIALSCSRTQHKGLLFIGCRHHGYPLPGNIYLS